MQLARQEQEVGTVKMIEDVQRTGESNGRKDSGAPASQVSVERCHEKSTDWKLTAIGTGRRRR